MFINPARVADVKIIPLEGPWRSKSDGSLFRQFWAPLDEFQKSFFSYNPAEFEEIPDIKGFRIYMVRDIPKGGVAGKEFHKVRQEIMHCLEGVLKVTLSDVYGGEKEFEFTPDKTIWIQPYILHTFEALKDGSGLLVITNTTFDAENEKTHDTYSMEEFKKLQQRYQ